MIEALNQVMSSLLLLIYIDLGILRRTGRGIDEWYRNLVQEGFVL